jgi:hypothetical protein
MAANQENAAMTGFLLLTLLVGIVDVQRQARREFDEWLDSQPRDVRKRMRAAMSWGRS